MSLSVIVFVLLLGSMLVPLSYQHSLPLTSDAFVGPKVNFIENTFGMSQSSVECRDYHSLQNSSQWCHFVNTTENCAMDEGFVNYVKVAFCHYEPKYLPLICTGYAFWLVFLFVGLGTTAEAYFCPALEFIAHNLKLNQNIAGLTIVAFGNGSPDIFSAIAAFTNSNPTTAGVAVGALLGAAMLVTTVVAGLVSTTQNFDLPKRPFMRDMVFFIATSFWLFYMLYQGKIDLANSIGFLCLYIVYVAVVVVGRYINQRQRVLRQIQEKMVADAEQNEADAAGDPCNERTPLLSPAIKTIQADAGTSNTNNNNLDANADWSDVRLRAGSLNASPRKIRFDVPEEHRAEEANETLTSHECSREDDEVRKEVTLADRSVLHILASGLNPIDHEEWKEARHIFKLILVVQVPWKFVCNATIPIVRLNTHNRGWNRPLHCVSLIVSPVFCVFATKGGHVTLGGVFPLWALLLVVGFFLATLVWFTSNDLRPPVYHWTLAYVGFVVAIIWTYITANEIVNLLQTFGIVMNLSNVIMGLTFLAWGNSIGDVVADVALAKQGFPRMSWSACFGGPLFNLLIGVGVPCTISILKNNGEPILVKFTMLEAVICGGVFFSLCFTFIVVPIRNFQVTYKLGYALIVLYLVWLVIAVLAGVNVFTL